MFYLMNITALLLVCGMESTWKLLFVELFPYSIQKWLDICNLLTYISLSNEEDTLVWMFHPSGEYHAYFYVVENNGGIIPIHTYAIWKLTASPRIHVFLWILTNNKTLTRYNLHKCQHEVGRTCLFCPQLETANHVFFKCFVVNQMW
jgi:hypothetical protein